MAWFKPTLEGVSVKGWPARTCWTLLAVCIFTWGGPAFAGASSTSLLFVGQNGDGDPVWEIADPNFIRTVSVSIDARRDRKRLASFRYGCGIDRARMTIPYANWAQRGHIVVVTSCVDGSERAVWRIAPGGEFPERLR